MARLPLEPFVYPEDLFTKEVTKQTLVERWWVLHTRPRAEKSVIRKLRKRRIAFFLPLYEHHTRRRGRVRSSFLPLFPGYVFLFGDLEARHLALETNQVARVLGVDDQEQMQRDLDRVYQLVMSGEALSPVDRLVPGSPVEITSGPFAGIDGKVLRRGKQLRLTVEIKFLQQGVSVEVESWMIRPVDTAKAPCQ